MIAVVARRDHQNCKNNNPKVWNVETKFLNETSSGSDVSFNEEKDALWDGDAQSEPSRAVLIAKGIVEWRQSRSVSNFRHQTSEVIFRKYGDAPVGLQEAWKEQDIRLLNPSQTTTELSRANNKNRQPIWCIRSTTVKDEPSKVLSNVPATANELHTEALCISLILDFQLQFARNYEVGVFVSDGGVSK